MTDMPIITLKRGSYMTKVEEILSYIKGKSVYVQMHNFPDPDAIASAYGMKKLLEAEGITAEIVYKGSIEKTVTAKMVSLLNIDILEIKCAEELDKEREVIIVDAQKGNVNIVDTHSDKTICIDHHPVYNTNKYVFEDIRPEVGACASIIASYYIENHVNIDMHMATALLYGIKVDTADMKRGVTQLDLDMFYKLYNMADHKVLNKLDTSVRQYDDLKAYAYAIANVDVHGDACFASTGDNCQESLIASICDFIMSLDGIDFAVAYSAKEEGVKLSIRSGGVYDAGRISNRALKDIGNGGGHEHMAGGFISYAKAGCQDAACIRKIIEDKFLSELRDLT